jgi:hypothetical protein
VFLDPFFFQATEEGLDDRIVPAVALAAHAWLKVVGPAESPPCIASELRALVGMNG